jgi:Ribonuclease G/E
VGSIVDVRVGHIDQFKFHEEFQVEYHLRKAGFLKMQEVFNKKLIGTHEDIKSKVVLKTEQEKLIAKN